MAAIEDMFSWLMTSGAYDALLPFFLIFTLVFAFLQKIQIFSKGGDADKKESKRFNVLISLIIGLMVVVPHVTNSYPRNADPISIIQSALPNVILWVVAIFSIWLLLASFGIKMFNGQAEQGLRSFLTLLSAAVVAIIFGYAAGWFPPSWGLVDWLDRVDAGVLQIILILGIVIAVLSWLLADENPPEPNGRSAGERFLKAFKSVGGKDE